MFARVELVLNERTDAVRCPSRRSSRRAASSSCSRSSTARQMGEVEIGKRREGKVEITAGLGRDEQVVIAGQLKIRDGAPVQAAAPPPTA